MKPSAHAIVMVFGVLVGVSIGMGIYTFLYAKGYSYFTNDPVACANCHVMSDHYNAWIKSSHRAVATCNDCHTPAGFIPKYVTKASNGFWHSFAFTTGKFPDPLRIKQHNLAIAQEACRKCHADIVDAIEGVHSDSHSLSCLPCHMSAGHFE